MNERIKQLAEQAKPSDKNGQKVRGLRSDYHDQWMEKFAELIVQECIAVNAITNKFLTGEASRLASEVPAYKTVMKSYETIFNINLKKHFGVE